MKLCKCGCGSVVTKKTNVYIHGHNNRNNPEVAKKISESTKGKKNHFYGKFQSEESKEKNRIAHLGATHTPEAKIKIGKKSKKMWENPKKRETINIARNKACDNEEYRNKLSEAQKKRKEKYGYINSIEARKKLSESIKGHKVSKKVRQKLREISLERYLKQGKFINYNENSIPFFEKINKTYNMKALFGKDEYKCLGYSLDFYSEKYNLVIEWDEPNHYIFGKLKEKDIVRQQNIINHLGCEFIRIDERKDLKIYEEAVKLFIVNYSISLFKQGVA